MGCPSNGLLAKFVHRRLSSLPVQLYEYTCARVREAVHKQGLDVAGARQVQHKIQASLVCQRGGNVCVFRFRLRRALVLQPDPSTQRECNDGIVLLCVFGNPLRTVAAFDAPGR